MNKHKTENDDPLLAGFYTMNEAARLLQVSSRRKLSGWLNGWQGSNAGPIVKRDFNRTHTISFLDLMELRFITHFRNVGVPLNTLRKAAENAREEWNQRHPFALSKFQYLSDRKEIFIRAAQEENDKKTMNLATEQYEMWDIIEDSIDKGVSFNQNSQIAISWQPDKSNFPNISIDPRRAFGYPCITEKSIPTATLFDQYRAEANRGGVKRVAEWFEISVKNVKEAIQFEMAYSHC